MVGVEVLRVVVVVRGSSGELEGGHDLGLRFENKWGSDL